MDLDFRNDHDFDTAGDAGYQGQITTVAAHYFNKKRSPVRRGSDLKPIDRLERDVESGINAYGDFRSIKIVVDCGGDSDNRKASP